MKICANFKPEKVCFKTQRALKEMGKQQMKMENKTIKHVNSCNPQNIHSSVCVCVKQVVCEKGEMNMLMNKPLCVNSCLSMKGDFPLLNT